MSRFIALFSYCYWLIRVDWRYNLCLWLLCSYLYFWERKNSVCASAGFGGSVSAQQTGIRAWLKFNSYTALFTHTTLFTYTVLFTYTALFTYTVLFIYTVIMEVNTSRMIMLNGTNYQLWRNKMKDLLFVKAMHLPVFAIEKPESKSEEDWEFEHQQVCGFIRQFVEENVYNHIDQETHARTLWDKLENLYASKSGNNKLFMLKKMMALRYKDGTSIADHVSEFQSCLTPLLNMGSN